METPIRDFVRSYAQKAPLRLHMPGHKGVPVLGPEGLDLTEVAGADELYHAQGVIRESEKNAAGLFGSAATFYSAEGSSLCIRAMLYLALLQAKREGRKPLVLAGRNAHKTFLSAAIAREVSGDGWSVVYDTAGRIFERFEDRKFGRDRGEAVEADVRRVLECDLLILDDLGTETATPFVSSALYTVLNTRLLEKRATIVSTNLKIPEIARRYSPQIASRLEGEYQVLPFFGEDIRKLKKLRERRG